jgi:hypothetical protein
VRDELERALNRAYLASPAPTTQPAASNLLAAPTVAGQRVQIVIDGSGVLATGIVVAAIPVGARIAAAAPPAEPRTKYCDEPGQENWP